MNQIVSPRRQRRWASLVVALALALLCTALAATSGTAQRAAADDGCNTDEAVACIPLPPEAAPTNPCWTPSDPSCAQPPAQGAAGMAVAVPVGVGPCPVYPDPYGPPLPSSCCTPGPLLGGIAVPSTPAVPVPPTSCCVSPILAAPVSATPSIPVPAPYLCPSFRGIYATINGGNAADVHALRTLSSAGLSQFWRQGALSSIQSQVADLQSRGAYATPRLYSIAVQDASFGPGGTAVVHTMEHWLYQERSLDDGSLQFSQDEWVANEYDLGLGANAWYITYNNAMLVPGP